MTLITLGYIPLTSKFLFVLRGVSLGIREEYLTGKIEAHVSIRNLNILFFEFGIIKVKNFKVELLLSVFTLN